MKFEEGIALVEELLNPMQLSKVQKIVFQQAWHGKSYQEIAKTYQYHPGYIKEVGSALWQSLSHQLGVRVTKHNFLMRLKQYQQSQSASSMPPADRSAPASSPPTSSPLASSAPASLPPTSVPTVSLTPILLDGQDAVDTRFFYGRQTELAMLKQWLIGDRCRLVLIWGMGGMGKSSLAMQLAQQLAQQMPPDFDRLIWRSLQDAPSLDELIQSLTQHLNPLLPCSDRSNPIDRLLDCLSQSRCLLILDRWEALFEPQQRVGSYRPGYEGYSELLRRIGQSHHQSSIVLISREQAIDVATLQVENFPVQTLHLQGLTTADIQPLLHAKQLSGEPIAQSELLRCYGGNPLAIKIAATTVQDLFAGSIGAFLHQKTLAFNGIHDLLQSHVDRLSLLEQQIMTWLAINRVPVPLRALQLDLFPMVSLTQLTQAVESLYWRSLLEKQPTGLTQSPMVMEYFTQQLIRRGCQELAALMRLRQGQIGIDTPDLVIECLKDFKQFALLKATSNVAIRTSQTQEIIRPILQQTVSQLGLQQNLVQKLLRLIRHCRHVPGTGYAVGNLLNLLRALDADLSGLDLSYCTIWQAYLVGVNLSQVNLIDADLAHCVLDSSINSSIDRLALPPSPPSTANSTIPAE